MSTGLLLPAMRNFLLTMRPEVVKCIMAASLEHLAWAADRISATLKLDNIWINAPLIQSSMLKIVHRMIDLFQVVSSAHGEEVNPAIALCSSG